MGDGVCIDKFHPGNDKMSFDNEKKTNYDDFGNAVMMTVMIFLTMKLRFEGIYEESRAVFLCNQGDGHRGKHVNIVFVLPLSYLIIVIIMS